MFSVLSICHSVHGRRRGDPSSVLVPPFMKIQVATETRNKTENIDVISFRTERVWTSLGSLYI